MSARSRIERDIDRRTDLQAIEEITDDAIDLFFDDRLELINMILICGSDYEAIGRFVKAQWEDSANQAVKDAEELEWTY